eukprot:scaffold3241_cov125-Cylindrotheca_fusiformis.AAC.3
MKLSSFAAPLLLVHSQEGESQEYSFFLRHGRTGDDVNPSLSLSSQEDKVNIATAPSNHHRLLAADSFWEEAGTFPQLDGAKYGGNRVSISGDGTFLASAPLFYSSGTGVVQFFRKQAGGAWKENTGLQLKGNAADDYFGAAVSLSNDGKRVAIGALQDDGDVNAKPYSGSISVYDMIVDANDGTWKWKFPPQVIHGEDGGDESGSSVALSKDGKTLAIGAPFNNVVRVYRKDGTFPFKPMGGDIDGESNEYFGSSVALSKDGLVLAVGALEASCSVGKVRVYYWEPNGTGGSWKQRGADIVGDKQNDELGWSVDLSDDGETLAVGANAIGGGYAKVFQWKDDNDADWQSIDNDSLTNLGQSVHSVSLATLSSETIILAVGASATVYTYKLSKDGGQGKQAWELLLADDEILGEQVSLSSNGKTLAIGNPFGDGAITVYKALSSTSSGSNGDPHCKHLFLDNHHCVVDHFLLDNAHA